MIGAVASDQATSRARPATRTGGRQKDGGGELVQYRLVMEPRAARRARQVVGSVLDGWRLGGLADDVVSCVSELVANVYEHAAKSATAELLVSWRPATR